MTSPRSLQRVMKSGNVDRAKLSSAQVDRYGFQCVILARVIGTSILLWQALAYVASSALNGRTDRQSMSEVDRWARIARIPKADSMPALFV